MTGVFGAALLNDQPANGDQLVEAWANGTECGSAFTTPYPANFDFMLETLGASERQGCAAEGDAVAFTINGAPASQTFTWHRDIPMVRLDLVAMPDYAWYWVEQPASDRDDGIGTVVQAFVDGHLCGQTAVSRAPQGFTPTPGPFGFSALTVPSAEVMPGCGHSGASVSFVVGGIASNLTVAWEPGLARIDLALPGMIRLGDANCDGTINAADALLVLRMTARLDDHPPGGCPNVQNVDCNSILNAVDALHILRFAAGLPSTVAGGCEGVGG